MTNLINKMSLIQDEISLYLETVNINPYRFQITDIKMILDHFNLSMDDYLEMSHTSMMLLEAKQRKQGGRLHEKHYYGTIGFVMVSKQSALNTDSYKTNKHSRIDALVSWFKNLLFR
jgi:hypothetical protein